MPSESISTATLNEANFALDAALRIGQILCETAFWDESGQQCNWIGRAVQDLNQLSTPVSAALGSDLYGGSTGIALFLAELYAHAPEPELKRTALGAILRSIRYLSNLSVPISPLSFFSGHLGMAYVVSRLQDHGLDDDLGEDFRLLLDQVCGAVDAPHLFDVINGSAGAIPVLLTLAKRPGLEQLRDLAITCGEEMRRAAQKTGDLYFWDATQASGPGFNFPPMGGLSHGASGMALALLELYTETGDAEFLQAARGAFAYEDSLFSVNDQNWFDLRSPVSNTGGMVTGTCATAWCHGAPGIALARVRAMQLDAEMAEQHKTMGQIALKTTISALERAQVIPRYDTTLCHGLAGLAEVALIFADSLADDSLRTLATQAAQNLIHRYGDMGDWPSGIPGAGPNPSLMTGVAGVGHHFLRLYAGRKIPPILLFGHTF